MLSNLIFITRYQERLPMIRKFYRKKCKLIKINKFLLDKNFNLVSKFKVFLKTLKNRFVFKTFIC